MRWKVRNFLPIHNLSFNPGPVARREVQERISWIPQTWSEVSSALRGTRIVSAKRRTIATGWIAVGVPTAYERMVLAMKRGWNACRKALRALEGEGVFSHADRERQKMLQKVAYSKAE
jgi:hypothetical protein